MYEPDVSFFWFLTLKFIFTGLCWKDGDFHPSLNPFHTYIALCSRLALAVRKGMHALPFPISSSFSLLTALLTISDSTSPYDH